MTKLLAFLACEKVIIEKQFDTPSLISVLQRVMFQAQTPPDSSPEIPTNALAPLKWAIFTMWESDSEDTGKTLHQRCELIMPDGSKGLVDVTLPFIVKEQISFNIANVMGFPVGQIGTTTLKMWLESPTGEVITPEHNYLIKVERTMPEKKALDGQAG